MMKRTIRASVREPMKFEVSPKTISDKPNITAPPIMNRPLLRNVLREPSHTVTSREPTPPALSRVP